MNTVDKEILKTICIDKEKSQRDIAKITGLSLGRVNKSIQTLRDAGYLNFDNSPTKKSQDIITSLKPKSAIILAAGRGLRMVPLCRDIPKALLEVKGEILIERLIKQLHEAGVRKIYIVVGYMKGKFEYLIDKYHVNLIVNKYFDERNNFFSLSLAANRLSNSYIVPCDIYCQDNPFSPIETYSWYMVTDKRQPGSSVVVNRSRELLLTNGSEGNQEIGLAYVAGNEATYIKNVLISPNSKGYYNDFWEVAATNKKEFILSAKIIDSDKAYELNTYDNLIRCDINSKSLNSEYFDIICESLKIRKEDISRIKAQKAGMTNKSFLFDCKGEKYIFRIPGEGSNKLINRQQEYNVYQQIQDKNLCDEIIYINPENGYKITKFIKNATNCNPENKDDVKRCMQTLRNFHEMNLSVDHSFDIFGQIDYYEKLRNGPSVYDDYEETKRNVFELKEYIDKQEKSFCLCHIDSVCDNFIFSNDGIRLIDWEYAGMQDPHVDIAMFAIYALYDKSNVDLLIDFYFQNDCDKNIRLKIYCYVAVCGLLWSNWCEYKAKLGETFGEYSLCQYRYAKDFYRLFKDGLTNE